MRFNFLNACVPSQHDGRQLRRGELAQLLRSDPVYIDIHSLYEPDWELGGNTDGAALEMIWIPLGMHDSVCFIMGGCSGLASYMSLLS